MFQLIDSFHVLKFTLQMYISSFSYVIHNRMGLWENNL